MAWARDKNGREVWLDESGVLPPMAREELDKPMPLPDWPGGARRHTPGVKVPEGFELMDAPAGARDGGRAAARSLHGGPTDVAGRGKGEQVALGAVTGAWVSRRFASTNDLAAANEGEAATTSDPYVTITFNAAGTPLSIV